MTLEVLADRFDVLREIAAIEHDLAAIARQQGWTADTNDIQRRLHAARGVVLEQVRVLLDAWNTASSTMH